MLGLRHFGGSPSSPRSLKLEVSILLLQQCLRWEIQGGLWVSFDSDGEYEIAIMRLGRLDSFFEDGKLMVISLIPFWATAASMNPVGEQLQPEGSLCP